MCEECEQQVWPGIRTPSKSMPNVVYSNQIAWCLTLGFEYLTTIVGCFAHLWCVKQWNRRHSIGNAWQVLQRYNIEFALWRDWWGLLAYCLLNHLRRNLDFGWKLFELIKKIMHSIIYLPKSCRSKYHFTQRIFLTCYLNNYWNLSQILSVEYRLD